MNNFIRKSIIITMIIVVSMIAFLPFTKVNADTWYPGRGAYPGKWTGVSSTSKRILEIMISQSKFSTFVMKTNCNYYNEGDTRKEHINQLEITTSNTDDLYHLKIPETYFSIYKPWGTYVGAAFNTLIGYENEEWSKYDFEESERYGAYDRVDKFDFSNESLGDISVLPDFSKWCFFSLSSGTYTGDYHFVYLNFSNCGITDLTPFKNNIEKLRLTRIYLEGNKVTKKDYEEFEKLAKQYEIIIMSKPTITDTTTKNNNSSVTIHNTTKALNNSNIKIQNQKITNPKGYSQTNKNTASKKQTVTANNKNNGNKNTASKKQTVSANNKNNGNKNTASKKQTVSANNKNVENVITYTTIITYHYGSNLNSWVDVKQGDVFAKEAKLIIHAEMSGDKAPYVPAEATDCRIKVNGKEIANNNGVGEFTVKENGKYVIEIKPDYYGEGHRHEYTFTNIDTKKPSYKLTKMYDESLQNGGKKGEILKITASDDKQLRAIYVNNKKIESIENKTSVTKKFRVTKSGNYKIKVEDKAGNIFEKTEYIKVDTTNPKIEKVEMKKNGNTVVGNNCRVKIGDTISFVLHANKTISGYGPIGNLNGQAFITINNVVYKSASKKQKFIKVNSNLIKFDIKINKEIMDDLADKDGKISKFADVKVYGITDRSNNHIDYTIKNKIYIDNTPPTVEKITITGGLTGKKADILYIDPDKNIKIETLMSEKLIKNPKVVIGNQTYTTKYNKEVSVNSKKLYSYTLTVSGKELVNKKVAKVDSIVPIKVTDITDLSGNKGEERAVNPMSKSSNNKYLYYGTAKVKGLTILPQYSKIKVGKEMSYYVYAERDGDYIKVKGEKLSIKVFDKSGKEIKQSNDSIKITKNVKEGKITIMVKDEKLSNITIKTEYKEKNIGDILTGNSKLNVIK